MTDLDRLRATYARLCARPDPSGWEERHRDDLAVALAEIDRLRAALGPFAEYAAHLDANHHPDEMGVGYYFPPNITCGDCRRAAELLSRRAEKVDTATE